MTIDTTLTAKLRASVRTLGAALGACMADPHTDKCRSLWLCEQHRALLETPAEEDGAGEEEPPQHRGWCVRVNSPLAAPEDCDCGLTTGQQPGEDE